MSSYTLSLWDDRGRMQHGSPDCRRNGQQTWLGCLTTPCGMRYDVKKCWKVNIQGRNTTPDAVLHREVVGCVTSMDSSSWTCVESEKARSPERISTRSLRISSGLCLMWNSLTAARRCSAVEAISPACRMPFLMGSPDTNM